MDIQGSKNIVIEFYTFQLSSKRMEECLDKPPEWAYYPSTTDTQEVFILCIFEIGGVRLDLSALHHRHGPQGLELLS